ncbi:50S ribosomal protein L23 [Candidatus Pacearchaeota archaeon]|nr:50S ribosomal protein L23 [Candidatus Pacearchaeota archaeon]
MENKKAIIKKETVKSVEKENKPLVKQKENSSVIKIMKITPLVTEKAVMAIERDNILTFKVDKKFNKQNILKEIEDLFDIKVERVRTSTRGSEKFAYVKLKKGFLAIDLATKLGII